MRRTVLVLAVGLALPTTVQAQWTGPGAGGSYGPSVTPSVSPYQNQTSPPNSSYSTGSQEPARGYPTRAPDAANCGTPEDPNPCPPMPRRALHDRPANRE